MFGETIARFVEEERGRLGSDRFAVAELGAGSGSLLAPLASTLTFDPDPLIAIDLSPAARSKLGVTVPTATVAVSLDEVAPFSGVMIANELIDNVPMALAVRQGNDWRERWVGSDGVDLVWVDAPVRLEVEEWLGRWAGPVQDGGIVEVQLEAQALVLAALGKLDGGALVLVDYGNTAEGLANRRGEGTVRTYQGHHLGPHPLEAPGETDLTADVNFSALIDALTEAGAQTELVRQDEFLEGLGIRGRLDRMRVDELAAARDGEAMTQLEVRSLRTAGETLLHPRGLGDFRVLIARV
ncbi:MAG TPA: hypothetical protein ENH15_02740 [Actinobacteria bacterium]|nr:hypothetical protein [Actinomycetota bacterium]